MARIAANPRQRPPGRLKKRLMLALINLYPPFVGAGIRVTRLDLAGGVVEARLELRWWNRNYVGTQFGGALYTLCDPFLMLILMEQLGPGFLVWDKTATIRFRRPGRTAVTARFEIPPEQAAEIRRAAESRGKVEPTFLIPVVDREGQVVVEVEKVLYVREKR